MSKTIDDGGAAFPLPHNTPGNPWNHDGAGGMNIRDYFAGKMVGQMAVALLPVSGDGPESLRTIATACYKVADAMIAEKRRSEAGAP